MPYLLPMDAPKPQFIVVVIYSEYEQSSQLFIDESKAREYAEEQRKHSEVYLARIVEV